MAEPSFVGAGVKAGLELWRIEALKPVKIPKIDGKFHQGDSYILLSTIEKPGSGAKSWNIHFWLGSETTHDEAGVAAYKSVELDDSLGGGPTQYREVEGNESSLFLSYFKSTGGIEYLPGGVESGFKHVVKDQYETRLLHLKGKRTVRTNEVPVTSASLNKGDVFILDTGLKIYIFNGPTANKYEKTKAIEVAQHINSDSRGGRAQIIHLEDDIHNMEFWGPLGGFVEPNSLPEGEDDASVVVPKTTHKLFHITDESGSTEFNEVPLEDGKLHKSMLHSGDVFLLHSASNKLYIWVGKGASLNEKREATAHATKYMNEHGLPKNTPMERISEGVESSSFKSEFSKWEVLIPKQSNVASTPTDQDINIREMLMKKRQEDAPIDDGSGKLQVWIVKDFKLEPIDPSQYGQFHGGDSYVLRYTYIKNRREEDIIYFWLGNKSSLDEIGSAALLAKEMDDSLGGRPVQVRVVQGKEPSHFRQLFKGRMIVHAGGHASGFKNKDDADTLDTDGIALFHVRGTNELNTHAVQVAEVATSLNSSDCFVLVTPTHSYSWNGNGSSEQERAVALNVATILAADYNGTGDRVVEAVQEGSESGEFWTAIGGQAEYPSSPDGEMAPHDPRLFHCTDAYGPFTIEEIADYCQDDLLDDDVYLLDLFTAIYVWIGSQSNAKEAQKATEFAHRFIVEACDGRSEDIPVIVVHAGQEPGMFTCHFTGWQDRPLGQQYVDPYEAKLAKLREEQAARSIEVPPSPLARLSPTKSPAKSFSEQTSPTIYSAPVSPSPISSPMPMSPTAASYPAPVAGSHSLADLKGGLPAGVDPTRKEEYLDAATFQATFGMDKAAFSALPKWKKDAKKKETGLF